MQRVQLIRSIVSRIALVQGEARACVADGIMAVARRAGLSEMWRENAVPHNQCASTLRIARVVAVDMTYIPTIIARL